jgi:hypothetical protein
MYIFEIKAGILNFCNKITLKLKVC